MPKGYPHLNEAERSAARAKKYAQTKAWKASRKAELREDHRLWVMENPEVRFLSRKRANLRKYGLSLEAFEGLRIFQKNICALCERPQVGKKSLAVDHDHSAGHVRGLLCDNCNHALGKFRDDPKLLRKAADYVERFQRIAIR